jgi:predicted RNase H-like nuclease (RuvC/YqgF family)
MYLIHIQFLSHRIFNIRECLAFSLLISGKGDYTLTDNHNENKKLITNQLKDEKSINKDAIMNLATDLMKDEESIDMGSIMRMATALLKDDTLMNSVKDLAKSFQTKALEAAKEPQKQDTQEITPLLQQIEDLNHELTKLKQELQDMKKQNEYLIEMILNQERQQVITDSEYIDREPWREQQFMTLTQELQEIKELMAALQKEKKGEF